MTNPVDEEIDHLLHDAEHATSGAEFAAGMNDTRYARLLHKKSEGLIAQATILYLSSPGAKWPECDIPSPARPK